jgi:hypothetical protein
MKPADSSDSSGALAPERVTLAAGESITVPIEAANPNRATGIHFEAGGVYRLDAAGKWYDAGRETDPAGYKDGNVLQNLVWWLRRSPQANWFALLGTAEPGQAPFPIGVHAVYQARARGELICFANDVPGFYWNNSGVVRLTVTRTK